ncbi:unnamed protein product [Gordionus sp. m RMFG-2023]
MNDSIMAISVATIYKTDKNYKNKFSSMSEITNDWLNLNNISQNSKFLVNKREVPKSNLTSYESNITFLTLEDKSFADINFVTNDDSYHSLNSSLSVMSDMDNIFLQIRSILDKNPNLKSARKMSIIAYSFIFVLGATANLVVLKSLFPTSRGNKTKFDSRKHAKWGEGSAQKENLRSFNHSSIMKHVASPSNKSSLIIHDTPLISYCGHKTSPGSRNYSLNKLSNLKEDIYKPVSPKSQPINDYGNINIHNMEGLNLKRAKRSNIMAHRQPKHSYIQKNHSRFNLHSRVRLLILHLCLADLLVIFLMVPLEIGWSVTISWRAGNVACKIFAFFRIFGLYLSSLILIVISIDRCYTICNPLKFDQNKFIKGMITGSWVIATLASLLQVLYLKYFTCKKNSIF